MSKVYISGPMTMKQYPWKCADCGAKFSELGSLATHKMIMHDFGVKKPDPGAFSTAVEAELKKATAELKAKLNAPNPLREAVTKEEKPMETMTYEQIGKAKKKRDVLRNNVRNDIQKFVDMFGVSNFEAAHAILDAVLSQVNDDAKQYGTAEMKHGLAQTLLPDTQALLGTAVTTDQTSSPSASLLTHATEWPTKPKAKKIITAGSATLKQDVNVTDDDVVPALIQVSPKYSVISATMKEMTNTSHYYVYGSKYYASYQKFEPPFKPGTNYVLYSLPKNKPYVYNTLLSLYNLHAPIGYKWRKLKNKPIYKLTKDPKQVSYWKNQEAKAQTAAVSFAENAKVLGMYAVAPYDDALSGKYAPQTGCHFETYISSGGTKVIVIPDDCANNSPKTKFPKDPVAWGEKVNCVIGKSIYNENVSIPLYEPMSVLWEKILLPPGYKWVKNEATHSITAVLEGYEPGGKYDF